MNNIEIINGLVNFSIVAVIFLISVAILFKIFCKKFKFNKKNIELYGLLLNLDTISLIAIASITINYLFLVWCTITFTGLNIIYIAFTVILSLIPIFITDTFKKLPITLLFIIANLSAVQIIYLIYNYLTKEYFSYILLLVLFLLIIFVFLYYTYNLFKQVNNIVIKNKYLNKKNYKL